ncbi:MAG: FAD-dependent oxidoreductase [Gammaproteobacteria bacterium]|nr:FAD-dependent oxidoreductase [Gammaproteobacteria bacterium]
MKKIYILIVLATCILGFFLFDLQAYLTLEKLKIHLLQFETQRQESPLGVAAIFLVAYVLITALSLPGAAILTLAAGALFGLGLGTLIVSFASSLGATLAFLVARYLLRDTVQQRFGSHLKTINQGMLKDGALYLLTLRLVPAFPFFLINLVMGLTPINTFKFYWVSQLGMFAGTLVYVNAGTELARITSLSTIVSPSLLLSFTLLGIFPFIVKGILSYIQQRRIYARWKRPAVFDRNLIVIGAGAGGLVTSYIAAVVKAKVTLIEESKMGGDCLNYGCVPSKALIKSATVAQYLRHADDYGLNAMEPQFSFRKVMERVHAVIAAVAPHDSVERYTELGVEVIQGRAHIIDPWTIEIRSANGTHPEKIQKLTTRSIVIATGASPFVPPIPGINEVGYVTSDTIWEEFAKWDTIPARLLVLGGGPIGCELAQSFARLGSQVTQIQQDAYIMPREDRDVSELVRQALTHDGVHVLTHHQAIRCEREGDRKFIVVVHQNQEKRLEFDALLCAVGRSARLKGYGLEELGIPTQRTVLVNEYLATLYPNIYAVGDVAGPYQFTHTASHMAWYAAVNALFSGFKKFKVDYSIIPWSTFTDPEVARVGLNEQEAKDKNIPYEVTQYSMDELDRAITDSATQGFVKVLTVPGKDKILGVTIVGHSAGDIITEFVLAMKYGLGLNKILGTIHIYPTFGEANKYVAGEWKRAHAPQKILSWLKHFHAWRRGG